MQHLITYDIASTHPDPHSAVLKRANEFNWYAWIDCSDGHKRRLPNTTLHSLSYLSNEQAQQGFDALLRAAERDIGHGIILEKSALMSWLTGFFISDKILPS